MYTDYFWISDISVESCFSYSTLQSCGIQVAVPQALIHKIWRNVRCIIFKYTPQNSLLLSGFGGHFLQV